MDEETRLAPLRQKLLAVREQRVRPGLDDKVLADWNGLMIAGLANAGVAFGEPEWLEMAARAFLCIATKMSRATGSGIPGAPASCCSRVSPPTTPT